MKQQNQFGKIMLLISVLMVSILTCPEVLANTTEPSIITSYATATGRCTNVSNEGIEYYYPITVEAAYSDRWRSELELTLSDDSPEGEIVALQLDVIGSTEHYQCTEIDPSNSVTSSTTFSCNTIPSEATIKGVYFYYKTNPGAAGSDFSFTINQVAGSQKTLNVVNGTVTLPSYPCSRNDSGKDLLADNDNPLIYNTSTDCPDDHQEIIFYESETDPYAFANMIDGQLDSSRFYIDISPAVSYSFTLQLEFEDQSGAGGYYITCAYDPDANECSVDPANTMDVITTSDLPLTLIGGKMYDIDTDDYDLWGNRTFPTSTNFTIKMYYGNTEGTIGYENSSFHFTRYLDITFAPYCDSNNDDGDVKTGAATTDYDKCQSTRQLFTANLQDSFGKGVYVPTSAGSNHTCSDMPAICSSDSYVYVEHDYEPSSYTNYYFATRKCADSSCTSVTTTTAYPYSLTVSDGGSTARTYTVSSVEAKTVSLIKMKAWDSDNGSHPFAIKEVRLMVDEPGTYVVYGFVSQSSAKSYTIIDDYAVKFYVTVNDSESIKTCSSAGNNGYFMSYWNDCLDYRLTQLLTFSQTSGEETAWIENRSATGIHYTYYGARSYLPKKFELASLSCSWSSVSGATGSQGYCNTTDIYVPAYTKVTVTGGTAYLESIPDDDDYTYIVSFVREDTMSIMDLNIDVQVKACENVKKIPDTGISLRSPLKVKESVKEDTSFVFTGNSLQIPAIGLGMEYPAPIVHVYYEEGAADRGWDLSTLGNYVGELEGGSYLPYAGNSVLTGHYYSHGVFKNLENLNPGDEIIILGNDGIKYTYRVAQKFYAEEDDVYEMFQQVGDRSLTLVTCDNYDFVTNEYSRRLLVRATIDHQEPYEMAAE